VRVAGVVIECPANRDWVGIDRGGPHEAGRYGVPVGNVGRCVGSESVRWPDASVGQECSRCGGPFFGTCPMLRRIQGSTTTGTKFHRRNHRVDVSRAAHGRRSAEETSCWTSSP
jgi:hypothetical protein